LPQLSRKLRGSFFSFERYCVGKQAFPEADEDSVSALADKGEIAQPIAVPANAQPIAVPA